MGFWCFKVVKVVLVFVFFSGLANRENSLCCSPDYEFKLAETVNLPIGRESCWARRVLKLLTLFLASVPRINSSNVLSILRM